MRGSLKLFLYEKLADMGNEALSEVGLTCEELQVEDPGLADNVGSFEIRTESLSKNITHYDETLDIIEEVAWDILMRGFGFSYLVTIENDMRPRSRLRSYKGLFPHEGLIRKGVFKETEVLRGDVSFFVGMAELNESNKKECIEIALNYTSSFFVSSDNHIGQPMMGQLLDLFSNTLYEYPMWFDYAKVISIAVRANLTVTSFFSNLGNGTLKFRGFLEERKLRGHQSLLEQAIDRQR